MRNLKQKLTSRKFWLALTSFVSMLIVATGGTEDAAKQIAAIIMAGASVVAYIIGEGLADAGNGTIELQDVPGVLEAKEAER